MHQDPLKEAKKSHYRRVYVFRRKRKHWIFIASRKCLSISKAQGRPNPFDVFAAMVITLRAHTHTQKCIDFIVVVTSQFPSHIVDTNIMQNGWATRPFPIHVRHTGQSDNIFFISSTKSLRVSEICENGYLGIYNGLVFR